MAAGAEGATYDDFDKFCEFVNRNANAKAFHNSQFYKGKPLPRTPAKTITIPWARALFPPSGAGMCTLG